ncbi:putative DNA helicase MCM9 [Gossypium australe]|uniref:DNA helicase n=1 Tax=Gossypium australe TaxID=47621 RepID=A0A5B6V1J1_9ROSI|nr:putative DNA helicase MCM9 [Gossypium australe]
MVEITPSLMLPYHDYYTCFGIFLIFQAGLVTTLSTRTIVFGATNPKGHYDPDQPLSVNTALSGPLLSRFDIVLVLLDTKNPEWDAVVSSHILGEGEYGNGKQDEDLANIWSLSILRRYIGYVKKNFKPVLTKEAEKVISSYYQLQRRSPTHNAARTTVRMLESLIRLAQAHARLMFRNEVTRLDAIAAILCIESSMTISAIIDSIGNALHSNFTENPDEEYAKQEKLILEKLSLIDESPANGLEGFN